VIARNGSTLGPMTSQNRRSIPREVWLLIATTGVLMLLSMALVVLWLTNDNSTLRWASIGLAALYAIHLYWGRGVMKRNHPD
jgi:hypothetical protein